MAVKLFMLGILLFGTTNVVLLKLMDLTVVRGKPFSDVFLQGLLVGVGQLCCLPYYLVCGRGQNGHALLTHEEGTQSVFKRLGKACFAVPALFGLVGSTLGIAGLALSAASITQMIRGVIIAVVAFYSIVLFKRKLFCHEWAGIAMTVLGIIVVGLISVLYRAPSARDPVLGAVCLVVGQLFIGGMMITEEKCFKEVKVDPLLAGGVEGLCNVIFWVVLLPIFNFIRCEDPGLCSGGYLADSLETWAQIMESAGLQCIVLCLTASIALFSWVSLTVTKRCSALTRSVVDTSRTALIWVVSLLLNWEYFLWGELLGFFMLVVGSLTYNEVLVLPWFGLQDSVSRKNRAKDY